MKNFTRIVGIAAIAVAIGLSFIGCAGGVSSKKLASHLASLDQKTVDTPTTVKLAKMTFTTAFPAPENTIAWAEINNTVKTAQKYIILDLSACTAADNTVTGQQNPENNDMNIIEGNEYIVGIILPLNMTSIGNFAFADCDSLTNVTIPNSVTTIGGAAFYSSNNLASITIGTGVTTIGAAAFENCALTSVTIPPSVTTIGDRAFSAQLTSVTIPASVTSIGKDAFVGCEVNVDPANTAYSSADGVLFDKAGTTLIQYPSKKTGEYTIPNGVTTIGRSAFANCEGLTSVIIPDGVTTIGRSAFANCEGLTSVIIPDGVTTIEIGAFASTGLTNITIPASITTIEERAFQASSKLTSVTFTGSGISIADDAFPPSIWGSRDNNPLRTAYTRSGPGTYTLAPQSTIWTRK